MEGGNNSTQQQHTQQHKVGNAGGDDHNSFGSVGLQSSNMVSSLKRRRIRAHVALIEETRQNKCAKNTLYHQNNALQADSAAQLPITHFLSIAKQLQHHRHAACCKRRWQEFELVRHVKTYYVLHIIRQRCRTAKCSYEVKVRHSVIEVLIKKGNLK